ncbi:MAG: hypothetical protein IPJ26_17020 [Bacteroidetes bacterium]|nr:hypothetical protein [Bacteroidota bacterium]
MSGKIRRDEKDKPEDILLLHITYFSEHYKNRVSKIGILELKPHEENDLNPIEINKEFIKQVENNPIYLLTKKAQSYHAITLYS